MTMWFVCFVLISFTSSVTIATNITTVGVGTAITNRSTTDSKLATSKSFINPNPSASDSKDSVTVSIEAKESSSPSTSVGSDGSQQSPTVSTTLTTSTTTTTQKPDTTKKPPSKEKRFCLPSKDDYCGKNGVCTNKTSTNSGDDGVECLCKGNYYGNRCQYKGDSLYKQLTYAFGGTTGFLLLVICCLLCCRKSAKQKKSEALAYSKELDEFTIANKRASTAANVSNNRNGFNM